jgi:hypothetical protein
MKIKTALSTLVLLGALFLSVTFMLLDGLSGPVGTGGILIIGGVYLAIGIAALIPIIYLATVSKIARYTFGIPAIIGMGIVVFSSIENGRENRTYDYSQDVINGEKLCPEVKYACLSAPDDAWLKTLYSTQSTLNFDDQEYAEVSEAMEVFYPGFWEETPHDERINWVKSAELIGIKHFSHFNSSRSLVLMAALSAVIGLDFETKEAHAPTVRYLKSLMEGGSGSPTEVLNYLYFAYLERDYDLSGRRYTNLRMPGRFTLFVEWPVRAVPRFDDIPEADRYHESQDAWKVFAETIEGGGTVQD